MQIYKKNFQHIPISDIVKLYYEDNISLENIGKRYSANEYIISNLLKDNDYKIKDKKERNIKKDKGYFDGFWTCHKVANLLNVTITSIQQRAKKGIIKSEIRYNGKRKFYVFKEEDVLDYIKNNKTPKDIREELPQEEIIKMYFEDNITSTVIAKKFNISKDIVDRVLNDNGLKLKSNRDARLKYHCNEDYFEDVDSGDKAYWLGFIAADGCVIENRGFPMLKIGLSIVDMEHLEKFKKCIDSTHNILIGSAKKIGKYISKPSCTLNISSKKMVNDLHKYGIVFRKTFKLVYPKNLKSEFHKDYIRGYFDGDGCISKTKSGQGFSLLGVEDFLYYIKNILYTSLNLVSKGSITKCKSISRFVICTGSDLIKLFDFLYYNNCVCLNRKLNKYNDILTKLKR